MCVCMYVRTYVSSFVCPRKMTFFKASETRHFLPGGSVLHGDHAKNVHLAAPTPVRPPQASEVRQISDFTEWPENRTGGAPDLAHHIGMSVRSLRCKKKPNNISLVCLPAPLHARANYIYSLFLWGKTIKLAPPPSGPAWKNLN